LRATHRRSRPEAQEAAIAEQIALRRAHCGSSDYAIYQAPSSACSPPTARPGTSMHEKGLAIDFTCGGGGTISQGSACFGWLDGHAAGHGLHNLPSEPWHWSTMGPDWRRLRRARTVPLALLRVV